MTTPYESTDYIDGFRFDLREEIEVEDNTPCERHFSLTITQPTGHYVRVEGDFEEVVDFVFRKGSQQIDPGTDGPLDWQPPVDPEEVPF